MLRILWNVHLKLSYGIKIRWIVFKIPKGHPKGEHDLVHLWSIAFEEGLPISQEPPDWVTILGSGHGPNFYFRYQEGKEKNIVHGGQTPALTPMAAELKKLIEMVGFAIIG